MMWRQLPAYSPLSAAAIRRAVLSGFSPGLDGQGEFRRMLERDYAADRAALFGSGTQALQVAVEMAMQQVGDVRVALPAFTCFDVASAAVGAGARISCYDVDPETLGPDQESLRGLLERGIRSVVITPLYGLPVDWDALKAMAASYDAILIEDAAQGHGAEWHRRPLGSFGPLSVLSFGRGKGWTGGAGGALLARGDMEWPRMSSNFPKRRAEARTLASLAAQWTLGRPRWYALPHALPWLRLGETVYRAPVSPRPMTRAASACLASLKGVARREGATRRRAARRMLVRMAGNSAVRPVRPLPGAVAGYLRLPIRLDRGRAGFENPELVMRLGLASSYPSTLTAIPQIQHLLDNETRYFSGAEELVKTLFTLPTHSLVSTAEQNELVAQLRDYKR